MKLWQLQQCNLQILKLRTAMGDMKSPPEQIERGYWPCGHRIDPKVHKNRQKRLISLENRYKALLSEGLNSWFNRTYKG